MHKTIHRNIGHFAKNGRCHHTKCSQATHNGDHDTTKIPVSLHAKDLNSSALSNKLQPPPLHHRVLRLRPVEREIIPVVRSSALLASQRGSYDQPSNSVQIPGLQCP